MKKKNILKSWIDSLLGINVKPVKKESFKVLVFNRLSLNGRVKYCSIMDGRFYESDTPLLRPLSCTIESIERHYPNLDFNDVNLITITVKN